PLGLGSTQSPALASVSCCRPIVAPGRSNAVRYTVMPTTASHCGARRATLAGRARPRARISAGVRSPARAVARATTLVMPRPSGSNCCCSSGRSTRSVKPAAYSAGQNRFPGRAKWYPVAAEYRPGLIPANSTRSPGATTSGIVLSRAGSNCSGAGRLLSAIDLRLIARRLLRPAPPAGQGVHGHRGGNCVEVGTVWRKSSYGGNGGSNCVEVARNLDGIVAVRDSKNRDGPVLLLSRTSGPASSPPCGPPPHTPAPQACRWPPTRADDRDPPPALADHEPLEKPVPG